MSIAHDAGSIRNETREEDPVCAPDADCNCGPPEAVRQEMSWPALLVIMAGGAAFCLLILKLLGA